MNNSIQDETAVDHGYGEGAPNGTSGTSRNGSSIRVSQLPKHIRSSAMKLDLDGDGALNEKDIAQAVGHLDNKEKENKNLQRIIVAFGILSVLLIAAIFGASIAAARLSREISVNPQNGFAYVKDSTTEVMKTGDAIVFSNDMGIAEMSNANLRNLREVILAEGDVRFVVKGYARAMETDNVLLLVEGGVLTYGLNGIVNATGNAKMLLEAAFGSDTFDGDGSEGQRRLWVTCADNYDFGYILAPYVKRSF